MYSSAGIAPVMFRDHFGYALFLIRIEDPDYGVQIMCRTGVGHHIGGKQQCLHGLRAAGKLGQGRRKESDPPFKQIKEEIFFGGFEAYPANDNIPFRKALILSAQRIVVCDDALLRTVCLFEWEIKKFGRKGGFLGGVFLFQKSISRKR